MEGNGDRRKFIRNISLITGEPWLVEMEQPPDITKPEYANTGMVFYRSDDWSATSYFYLDSPWADLPGIASKEISIREILD
jgi:hypothetical protein